MAINLKGKCFPSREKEPTREQIKKAFQGTIERWERIVKDPSYYHASDCQLCRVYGEYEGDKSCHKYCPIRSYGNHAVCVGTPHDAFSNCNSSENALAELNFLRKVCIWWMEEGDKDKKWEGLTGYVKEKKKEEWVDITDELTWEIVGLGTGFYYLGGYYEGERVVNADFSGVRIPDFDCAKNFKVENDHYADTANKNFRILKKI